MAEVKRIKNVFVEEEGTECVIRVFSSGKYTVAKLDAEQAFYLIKALCSPVIAYLDVKIKHLVNLADSKKEEIERLRSEFEKADVNEKVRILKCIEEEESKLSKYVNEVQKCAMMKENLRAVLNCEI